MSTARSESQASQFSRRRSNTAQSVLRPIPVAIAPPLREGDSIVLNLWVHDLKESASVLLNPAFWPGVRSGDLLKVTSSLFGTDEEAGFLFVVPPEDSVTKPQLQISIPQSIADAFELRNNEEVTVTKVVEDKCSADYVELCFQDQYLGRNDMWRLGKSLVNECIHKDQDVGFIGATVARVQGIYNNGRKVSGAFVTSDTKAIYRSLSAKITIFIQVCRELWQFSGDGERYNEKIVHSFLPALFAKWRDAGTNHTVTIVLISRVYYDLSEIDYAAGPLRKDEQGNWYKDFYKVITDLEVIYDWKPTLVSLKTSFWDFQRDILLTHHYHRAAGALGKDEPVRLVGRLSYAHDGPILEALNLTLNPAETHYIDRSLSLTGASCVLITPGTGYFRVSKHLLRLTTTRMLDQGIGMDLVCLTKPPLHQSPIFSFQGTNPSYRPDKDSGHAVGSRANDPLWGGDDEPSADHMGKTTFWWEPFFISVSFWDQQMDLPFRQDRFVARAKMHEIQMLGLLAHDVLSSIEVPFLPENIDPTQEPHRGPFDDTPLTKEEIDKFDLDVFAVPEKNVKANDLSRTSLASSIGGSYTSSSVRSNSTLVDRRSSVKASITNSGHIHPIEESPGRIIKELPPDDIMPSKAEGSAIFSTKGLSTSPSQSSILSAKAALSGQTAASQHAASRTSIASKLAPSWLRNPFRSGPSEPQTSTISAAGTSNSPSATPTPTSAIRLPPESKPTNAAHSVAHSTPMAIKQSPGKRASLSRLYDDEALVQNIYTRRSPINTPPRDDPSFLSKRRGTNLSMMSLPPASSYVVRPNPSRPQTTITYAQSSLARRWQHMFPQVVYKQDVKWKSLVTPGCLPLTVEYFPSAAELESSYDVFSYDFVVDPEEMHSPLVKAPTSSSNLDELRRKWALVVMRGMAAVRLAQGFQFVLASSLSSSTQEREEFERQPGSFRRNKSFMQTEEDMTPRAKGAAEILSSTTEPVYLSMSNEIHRIAYTGEAVQVQRYVRRMPPSKAFEYQCLIWPKLGEGYTELKSTFESHGLEDYGWNRLDMLVAGYEQQFNESLRYWRTRFVVVPTLDPPQVNVGPLGEKLNDEEARLLGIEKLAEQFNKLRRSQSEDKNSIAPAVRFLPTTLNPAISILDPALMEQLDQIHAAGPLRKKMKSERAIGEMSLTAIAKAMHEQDGLPIKHYKWHHAHYPNAFTGFDLVSWLVREFLDVGSRGEAVEKGNTLMEQGLFEHCRQRHGLLDGHYFYHLKGEYAVQVTPKAKWFTYRRPTDEISTPGSKSTASPRRNKKRLILSQSMVIDIDPNEKSDQAESVILHHDIIHNPATVFHFELQWIGTTARCIEDNLRQWNRAIERYGLKLVEAYVMQIGDVRERNAFQSCFPIRLSVSPPIVPDLNRRVPEGTHTEHYFEYALLSRFGFIVDVEAGDLYPEQVDVIYSYRRAPYKYSQFVHRSGVAFVQVLGGSRGFIFLTNRLIGPGRMGTNLKSKVHRPQADSENLRHQLQMFCEDPELLKDFYGEQIAKLGHAPVVEEPPDLKI